MLPGDFPDGELIKLGQSVAARSRDSLASSPAFNILTKLIFLSSGSEPFVSGFDCGRHFDVQCCAQINLMLLLLHDNRAQSLA